jgi:hypothetical protein
MGQAGGGVFGVTPVIRENSPILQVVRKDSAVALALF